MEEFLRAVGPAIRLTRVGIDGANWSVYAYKMRKVSFCTLPNVKQASASSALNDAFEVQFFQGFIFYTLPKTLIAFRTMPAQII